MARPQKLIPSYRKHKPSGQAVVTIASRTFYLGPHGTKASLVEYDRLIAEWLASGRSPTYGAPDDGLTIAELVAGYLRHAKRYYGGAPKGEYGNMVDAVRPLVALYKRAPATDFGPLPFKAIRQKLIDDGLARTTINARMRRIVRVFRWGAGEGLIPVEVAQTMAIIPGLRKGRSEARESAPIQPVDQAIVDATIAELPEIVADMVRLQRVSGMRPAELCIMRPCDLDRSADVWTYRPESHKTEHHGRDRVVFLGPQAQAILLKYLARDPAMYCFRPCDSEEKRRAAAHAARKTPIGYGNKPGTNRKREPKRTASERYSVDSYRRAIQRAAAVATVESWAPNQLRHTCATDVRKQFGLEAAQIVLGHSRADVTQTYAERDAARGVEVARAIG